MTSVKCDLKRVCGMKSGLDFVANGGKDDLDIGVLTLETSGKYEFGAGITSEPGFFWKNFDSD